jgi:acyl-CoA thioesterase-1
MWRRLRSRAPRTSASGWAHPWTGQAAVRAWRHLRGSCWAAALAIAGLSGVQAQTPANVPDAEACLAANRTLSLGAPLARSAARLKAGDGLRMVAVGSSSTTGLWVLSPSATYPEVLRRELARLRPAARFEVINSGRIGETVPGSVARFERDVLAHGPDLVIWQLGTNDVAWGGNADGLKDLVAAGVRTLKASGADVVLMDLQYAPMVLAASHHQTMQAMIADVARSERVALFSRFMLMRRSIDAGLPSGALVSWDGLHNSVAGYDCVGRALARAIVAAAR